MSLVGVQEDIYKFGPFRLDAGQRMLSRGDEEVRIGSRALDVLIMLVKQAGQIVSSRELIAEVWPNSMVVDSNLTVHISALRRILEERRGANQFISNVPGRGYIFIHPVERLGVPPPDAPIVRPRRFLPWTLNRIVGRDDDVAKLSELVSHHRLVSIVGPGGVGKTVTALAVASKVERDFEAGVIMIDLSPLRDVSRLAGQVAGAIGASVGNADALSTLLEFLRGRRCLLLLDNCEHVIDAVANLIVQVLRSVPEVHIVTTSRERLRSPGEWVYDLNELAVPDADRINHLSAAEALRWPAVELFVERAKANSQSFQLTDANAPIVTSICSRLDGIPLAIEFAAAQINILGLNSLAQRLDSKLSVLTIGRRDAPERHRTLKSALDWSYDLLDPEEQDTLCSLSVFLGPFDFDDAIVVAGGHTPNDLIVEDHVQSLVAKSLVSIDHVHAEPVMRLLESTREYAAEKLAGVGREQECYSRHARRLRDVFAAAEREWTLIQSVRWKSAHDYRIDDLRAAMEWAFGVGKDAKLGCELLVHSTPLWIELSLLSELRDWAELANSRVAEVNEPPLELRVANLLAVATMETGVTPVMGSMLTKALHMARYLGDAEQELSAVVGLRFERGGTGDFEGVRKLWPLIEPVAQRAGHPWPSRLAKSHRAYDACNEGKYVEAYHHTRECLNDPALTARGWRLRPFEIDPYVTMLANKARLDWIMGRPDTARRVVEDTFAEAHKFGHSPTYYFSLVTSSSLLPLWLGDIDWAQEILDLISEEGRANGLPHWTVWERTIQIGLAALQFQGNAPLPSRPDEPPVMGWGRLLLATVHESLLTEEVSARAASGVIDIASCEAFRGMGERALASGDPDGVERARAYFVRAQNLAREESAASWELRAATSLAKLELREGNPAEARSVLGRAYASFSEGFGTRDLQAARSVLDEAGA